ncbi:amidohydrolase family protein [Amycolatopsis sp. SID8362]|uniref:amidohydrolase n=1 Tax=Amycolatopsis sp. SID8362 TaxID=2690346 RepID=UPI0028162FD3|nr:amidohydrolase family protein [Amycolatopsis sp. SID8362]
MEEKVQVREETMTAQRIHPADLVVHGGVVHTFDADGAVTGGLAVRAGRVTAVGDDLTGHIGPGTEVLDLAGRAVLPGVNDAHLHATWLGARWPHPLLGAPHEETPVVTAEDRRTAILRAGDVCAALGITSYTEPGLGPGETGCFSAEVLAEYANLHREGRLRARVTVLRLFGLLDGASSLPDFARGLATPVPAADPEWLAVPGVKIFADGIPPMRTAWTHHCYADGSHGALLVDGPGDGERAANLAAMISLAHEAGLVVGVHATGERSIETALTELREGDHLVHGDLVTPAQLRRMAERGVGLTTQPAIATAMRPMVATALGADVAAKAWPLREILDLGVRLTLSSDAPVVTPDWRVHLAAAGELLGARGVTPELTARLLRCYTTEAAVQDGSAAWKGALAPGMVADFCVLGADPLGVELADLPSVTVELTVTGGRIVHKG